MLPRTVGNLLKWSGKFSTSRSRHQKCLLTNLNISLKALKNKLSAFYHVPKLGSNQLSITPLEKFYYNHAKIRYVHLYIKTKEG